MKTVFLAALAGIVILPTFACSDSSGPSNARPVAAFRFVCAALRCDFENQSSDDVGIASELWTFGDGATSTGESGHHVYAEPGIYRVSLSVTDSAGLQDVVEHDVTATPPVVAHLECADGTAPGGSVRCTLQLMQEAGFRVKLVGRQCHAHGNIFRLTTPVTDTLTTDGCYEQVGIEKAFAGPFAVGTEIDAEILAPQLPRPPKVLVNGSYPEWTLSFEDGQDEDFNDLILTVTALPTGN